ncbi:MAG: nuclear transport factor 2 family protein [Rhodopila sp.]|nr:nuclear transport factor 2 family protein [Rhodopila sp.]
MSEDESELRIIAAREDALYAALTASDVAAMQDIFAEDVTYIHSTSVAETKAENIAGQAHGVHRHGPIIRLKERKTRVFADIAVTRGLIDMADTAHGPSYTMRLRETLVWVKEKDGVWRLLVRHASRLPI